MTSLLKTLLFTISILAVAFGTSCRKEEVKPLKRVGGAGALVNPYSASLRKLTNYEYRTSIKEILGLDVSQDELPADTALNGFNSIGAARIALNSDVLSSYKNLALRLATEASSASRRQIFFSCTPSSSADSACIDRIIEESALKLWRRAPSALEKQRYQNMIIQLFASSGVSSDATSSLRGLLYAMLQSPNFLYRSEIGSAYAGGRAFDSFEIASRLAYLIWGGPPDSVLLQAAKDGQLNSPESILMQAQRMIAQTKFQNGLHNYFRDYLELDQLNKLARDNSSEFEQLKPHFKTETLFTISNLIVNDHGDYRDLLTYNKTYINGALARHYGFSKQGDQFEIFSIPTEMQNQRQGILTQASFLSHFAHPIDTSPTKRGLFIRQKFLCQSIGAPPDNAPTFVPAASEQARTMRQRVELISEQASCAGCHRRMDPLGFAFENFAADGKYRQQDNQIPVDASGSVDDVNYTQLDEFFGLLRQHERFAECAVLNFFRYANGRLETPAEGPVIKALADKFAEKNYNFQELIFEYVASPLFLNRPPF
ncbi:MAG: DUF1592 domain-containing protein [Oligoflexales bacterium]|nr:DUF1592 domain-containing protein [Oligoflexales bacterium]